VRCIYTQIFTIPQKEIINFLGPNPRKKSQSMTGRDFTESEAFLDALMLEEENEDDYSDAEYELVDQSNNASAMKKLYCRSRYAFLESILNYGDCLDFRLCVFHFSDLIV
jgi:hypothetical protein